MPDCHGIDSPVAIEGADTWQQIAERQRPLHLQGGEAKGQCYVFWRTALLHQLDETLPAGHFVGIEPGDILDQ